MDNKKTFSIPVSNGLLEHCPKIGEAIWLFLYLLDKQTRGTDKNGNGKVYHGVPIRDRDIERTLGQSRFTIVRWRKTLRNGEYIIALRTPYGFVYSIPKPKKWQERCDKNATSLAGRDVQNSGERCAESGVEMCDSATNKEGITDITVVVEPKNTSAAAPSQMEEKELLSLWNYYLDAFDKDETFTPQRKKQGLDRMRELGAHGKADWMSAAIDMAKSLSKKKPFFSQWHCIFGKPEPFASLLAQYGEMKNPPPAAAEGCQQEV